MGTTWPEKSITLHKALNKCGVVVPSLQHKESFSIHTSIALRLPTPTHDISLVPLVGMLERRSATSKLSSLSPR